MTSKVNPSPHRRASSFKTAGAIAYGGGNNEGFIVPASEPTPLATQDADIDETALNAFSVSSSASSLDVTIDPGEAFIFGAWACTDTSTTVSLDASTDGQTVYVGWDRSSTDELIIGRDSAFASASDDSDQRVEIASFDTDSSGVTSVSDNRVVGHTINPQFVLQDRSVESDQALTITPKYGSVISGPLTVDGTMTVDGSLTDTIGPISGTGSISGEGVIKVID